MRHEDITIQETIESERFVLRPCRKSDAGLIAMYAGDDRVAPLLLGAVHGGAGVIEHLVDAPDGKHFLWQSGWSGWKPAVDVQAVQDALMAGEAPPVRTIPCSSSVRKTFSGPTSLACSKICSKERGVVLVLRGIRCTSRLCDCVRRSLGEPGRKK